MIVKYAMRITLLFILILISTKSNAHSADSLRQVLKLTQTDTAKIWVYYQLSMNFEFRIADSSFYYAQEMLKVAEKTNSKKGKGFAYMMLGTANFSKSDYAASLQYSIQAANILEQMQPQPKELCEIYGTIISIYGELNDYALGRVYADKCVQFAEKMGSPRELVKTYNNVANFYENLKMFDKTIFYEKKAFPIAEKNNLTFSKAIAYFNMGSALRQIGKQNEGKYYIEKSLEISRTVEDIEGFIYCYIELAHLYREEKKPQRAFNYLDSAFVQLQKNHSWDLSREAYLLKSQIFEQQNQYDSAYYCFRKATIFKDSIFNETRQNMVHNYNTNQKIYQLQRENQQKEQKLNRKIYMLGIAGIFLMAVAFTLFLLSRQKSKHNQLLYVKNLEIERQKEELHLLNNNKDKLISIISHDLRSPFNQLKSLLALLEVKVISPQDFSTITQKLNLQVNTISENLEYLLQWVQSQISGKKLNSEPFDVSIAIQAVLELYETPILQKQIQVETQIPEGLQGYMDKETLKVALRNLISNAIKFSYVQSILAITAGKQGQEVFITIKDNGLGMSEEQLANLFLKTKSVSSLGTLKESGTGLGLKLSNEFIEKAGGRMEVQSQLGKGTTFTIFMPIDSAVNVS